MFWPADPTPSWSCHGPYPLFDLPPAGERLVRTLPPVHSFVEQVLICSACTRRGSDGPGGDPGGSETTQSLIG
jgi:hypothetical protein